MGRLDRFKKLERARADAPDASDAVQPHTSGRFGKIEERHADPAAAAPDPFAPPPDGSDAEIELVDDRAERAKFKGEKRSKAQAALDEERQRRAEIAMQQEAQQGPLERAFARRGALLGIGQSELVYLGLGVVVVVGALAAAYGKLVWGIALAVIAILVGLFLRAPKTK